MSTNTSFCLSCCQALNSNPYHIISGHSILKCENCGLGCTIQNSDFSAENYYSEEYFSGKRTDGYSDYIRSEKVLKLEFDKILKLIQLHSQQNGKLLELGCAYGFFLDVAKEYFNCHGIEISKHAVSFCQNKGLKVFPGELDATNIDKIGTIDIAVLLDCIEHLPNPHNVIEMISSNMQPNGTILITTGDWNTVSAKIMGKKWRLLTPPQHLFFFTYKSLKILLEKNGFKIVQINRPFKWVPIGLVIFQIFRYMGIKLPIPNFLHTACLPINLFDTICIVGKKQ